MSSSAVVVGPDDLVTGEAVALELPETAIAMHALAGILNVVITLAALVMGLIMVPIVTQACLCLTARNTSGADVGDVSHEFGSRRGRGEVHLTIPNCYAKATTYGFEPECCVTRSGVRPQVEHRSRSCRDR
jgi:hypothetical protein